MNYLNEFKECPSVVIALHSEDEIMLIDRKSIRDNASSVHDHEKWRNWQTAFSSTEAVLKLAKEAKKMVHILHITTKQEVELIQKSEGAGCSPRVSSFRALRSACFRFLSRTICSIDLTWSGRLLPKRLK